MAERAQSARSGRFDAILRRVHAILGVPVSLHIFEDGRESARAAGCGGCASCRAVGSHPWGAQACRKSRETAAAQSAARGRPLPFLCHMGFPCVALTTRDGGGRINSVLTAGPYRPPDAPGALERDAKTGWQRVSQDGSDSLPFSFEDIPEARTDAVCELAIWTLETLTESTDVSPETSGTGTNPPESLSSRRGTRKHGPKSWPDRYNAQGIATALAATDIRRARQLVERAVGEPVLRGRPSNGRNHRARTLAVTAAALDAADRAGLDTESAWTSLETLPKALRACSGYPESVTAAMHTLKKVAGRDSVAALDEFVAKRLPDPVTLRDAAMALGTGPTTITKRLQRRFGTSFTEYVARIRVQRAQALLLESKLSIAHVARRVGIEDPSNFAKVFRRHAGLSPTEYRKNKR